MKRSITNTYWKLIAKFREQPSGKAKHLVFPSYADHDSQEVVRVSYAHKVCLAYLIWLGEQHLESAEAFTKAAIRWRKEIEKFSNERTLLERISRKNMKTVLPKLRKSRAQSLGGDRGMRSQMSKGLGIYHPDYPPERRKETGRIGGLKSAVTPQRVTSKKWLITDQKGNTFVIDNLRKYCRDNDLERYLVEYRIRKNIIPTLGGYIIRKYEEPEEGR
jgi:hypothetical protein